jgi:hypothetical protein
MRKNNISLDAELNEFTLATEVVKPISYELLTCKATASAFPTALDTIPFFVHSWKRRQFLTRPVDEPRPTDTRDTHVYESTVFVRCTMGGRQQLLFSRSGGSIPIERDTISEPLSM